MDSSADQIKTEYSLMSENQITKRKDVHQNGNSHPRTASVDSPKQARLTSSGKTSATHQGSESSLTPLLGDYNTSTDNDDDANGENDVVFLPLEGESESRQNEGEIERLNEEDISPPSSPSEQIKPKGILKRSSALRSGSTLSSGSSSPVSRPSSLKRGGWRKESRVQFERPSQHSESIQMEDYYESEDQDEMRRTDDRLLSGSRIRSSLTRLSKLSSIKRKNPRPPQKKLERLQSQLKLDDLSRNEIELKASLYFHIGNPIKRWRVDRVVPVKLLLQLLKTFCLVVQVILFRIAIPQLRSEFFFKSRVVFESLFIIQFQDGITMPRDFYSIFTIQDMYAQFDHISTQYFALPDITIGGYDFESIDENGNPAPLTMELTQYKHFEFNIANNSYTLNGDIDHSIFHIRKGDNTTKVYLNNSQDPLFHRFISLVIQIPIKNIRIVDPERAECFLFNVTIRFENTGDTGNIQFLLEETHEPLSCNPDIDTRIADIRLTFGFQTALDVMIIIMSLISITLIISTLRRGVKLGKAMRKFYLLELGIKLKWREIRALFPLWHAANTISDLLIISGTTYKILVDYSVNDLDDATPTALLLGTAILFQAVLILRYISYFKTLNALTRTCVLAFPELIKFGLCILILLIAFIINGWVIIGPFFTEKFGSINGSLESLFALVNGDDVYNTFTSIQLEDNVYVYVYSRFYLYIFLILFLYFVLNLFTSLVIKSHEASSSYDTAYENEVRRFVFSGPLTLGGAALRDVTETKNYVDPEVILKRMKGPAPPSKEDTLKENKDQEPHSLV